MVHFSSAKPQRYSPPCRYILTPPFTLTLSNRSATGVTFAKNGSPQIGHGSDLYIIESFSLLLPRPRRIRIIDHQRVDVRRSSIDWPGLSEVVFRETGVSVLTAVRDKMER